MNILKENLTKIAAFCFKMLIQFNFLTVRTKIYWINIEKLIIFGILKEYSIKNEITMINKIGRCYG